MVSAPWITSSRRGGLAATYQEANIYERCLYSHNLAETEPGTEYRRPCSIAP